MARRRLRVRSLLLLTVLIPMSGLVVLAAVSVGRSGSERATSIRVEQAADELAEIVDARVAVAAEAAQTSILSIAFDLGIDLDLLDDLTGVDNQDEMVSARERIDADPLLTGRPDFATALAGVRQTREALDAGTIGYSAARAPFDDLIAVVDATWKARYDELRAELDSDSLDGSMRARADGVAASFEALRWGAERVSVTVELLRPGEASVPDPDRLARWLDVTTRHRAVLEQFPDVLGPEAAAEWAGHLGASNERRFVGLLDDLVPTVLADTSAPLTVDTATFVDTFVDGAPYGERLSALAGAAAADLRQEAASQEVEARQGLQTLVVISVVFLAVSIAGVVWISGAVARPVRRLEAAAEEIREGHFDLASLATTGPRELADTAEAFNDMTATLAAVEAHAVALADDPESAFLDDPLPGRVGRAMQVALRRLRASIRGAEVQRRQLEYTATHDGMTGLLSRSAALAALDRQLASADREGRAVMVLFVDLDNLKAINDLHGHAAGDDAITLTAEALADTTRAADIVARLGGDEFLVAGTATDGHREVQLIAERIHAAVEHRKVAYEGGSVPLRCSIGMALSGPATSDVDELIREADAALYVAKAQGRGRVAWSPT